MTTDFWTIRAVTNLHPGRGDASFGIIDKLVQRDAVSGLPTIYGSSVKGALRQLFDLHQRKTAVSIFGSDIKLPESDAAGSAATGIAVAKGAQGALTQGSHIFFNARLVALPIRATHGFFYMATCPGVLNDFAEELTRFGHPRATEATALKTALTTALGNHQAVYFGHRKQGLRLEDIPPEHIAQTPPELGQNGLASALFGPEAKIAVLTDEHFASLAEELPTVARNYLENGVSANLWYEEFVPRESRFVVPIAHQATDTALATGLALPEINHHVQIGANATVGYGFTEWNAI